MNFSKITTKSFYGKLLRWPLKLLPKKMVLPVLQGHLKGKKWIVGSSVHSCWLGCYEQEQQSLFGQMVQPGSVVYDFGGHVGFYSLLASALTGKNGQVVVFEPFERNVNFLKKHITLNKCQNIKLIPAAVADKEGTMFFKDSACTYQGKLHAEGKIKIKTIKLDSFCQKHKLPLPHFMKIDIEGAEYSALKGAVKIIKKSKPSIFLSLHGKEMNQKCGQFLSKLGYSLKPLGNLPLEDASEIIAVARP